MACSQTQINRLYSDVTPIPSNATARVSASDIVETMAKAGFTRDEILTYGPQVRNALAMQGGAEIRQSGQVTAVLTILEGSLYVVSQRGGIYVHSLKA